MHLLRAHLHCRQPLAVISVVTPADPADITPPEVLLADPSNRQSRTATWEDDLATLGNWASGSIADALHQ